MKTSNWQTFSYFVLLIIIVAGVVSCGGSSGVTGLDSGIATQVQIEKYKSTKEKISATFVPFDISRRAELYQSMDMLPQIVWGKVEPNLINKKTLTLSGSDILIEYYDLDRDKIVDLFVFKDPKGEKNFRQDFGFPYDLNKDGRFDYILYNGGLALSNNKDFYHYLYHWIDTDFDGKLDVYANNIVSEDKNSETNPNVILWVMDRTKDGKPDLVDLIDIQKGEVAPLESENGIWTYYNMFGVKKIDSDQSYFAVFNELLRVLNEE